MTETEIKKTGANDPMDAIVEPAAQPKRKPKSAPKHQDQEVAKPEPRAEGTAKVAKAQTKAEARRSRNQMKVCWIFFAALILVMAVAIAYAIRIPLCNAVTNLDVWKELACCCTAFVAGAAGKWTLKNAIL